MRVIDLLQRIANGERPEKIKYKNKIYNWSITTGNYILEDDRNVSINWDFVSMFDLRNEVEIIEEDKKIEKLKQRTDTGLFGSMVNDEIKVAEAINKQANYLSDIVSTINEIIDYLEEK